VRWVEPRLIGEVQYRKVGRTGQLRHAAWRGLRSVCAGSGLAGRRIGGVGASGTRPRS
jgi:hypothetical protein